MTTILATKDKEYFYVAADGQATGYDRIHCGACQKIVRVHNFVGLMCGDVGTLPLFKMIVEELSKEGTPNILDFQRYFLENKEKLRPMFEEDRLNSSFFILQLAENDNVVKAFEVHWYTFSVEEWQLGELDRLLAFGSGSQYALGAYKTFEKSMPGQSIQQRLIASINIAADIDLYTNKNISLKKFKLARTD